MTVHAKQPGGLVESQGKIEDVVGTIGARISRSHWFDHRVQLSFDELVLGGLLSSRRLPGARAFVPEDGRVDTILESCIQIPISGAGEGANPVICRWLVSVQNDGISLACFYFRRIQAG